MVYSLAQIGKQGSSGKANHASEYKSIVRLTKDCAADATHGHQCRLNVEIVGKLNPCDGVKCHFVYLLPLPCDVAVNELYALFHELQANGE